MAELDRARGDLLGILQVRIRRKLERRVPDVEPFMPLYPPSSPKTLLRWVQYYEEQKNRRP